MNLIGRCDSCGERAELYLFPNMDRECADDELCDHCHPKCWCGELESRTGEGLCAYHEQLDGSAA